MPLTIIFVDRDISNHPFAAVAVAGSNGVVEVLRQQGKNLSENEYVRWINDE